MTKKIIFLIFLSAWTSFASILSREISKDIETIGPKTGTLVIVGGGRIGPEIYEAFARYAGGFDAPIVVIPTANAPAQIDTERTAERWRNRGFTNVKVLHTNNPEEADTEEFSSPVRNARGVWFEGGRQWRLVDSYFGTASYEAFHEVLLKGGVIGGTSAGATIQGSFLARGDESGNTIMISPNEKHRKGFGFLKNTAIDQHVDARERWTDMQEIIRAYPELLGIGIAEATAVIVQGNTFRVLGPGKVAITEYHYLDHEGQGQGYLLLRQGDWYDLKKRKVIDHQLTD
jgi:cyanophycinase